jgi:succinyl-CoA synthetase beta subunit
LVVRLAGRNYQRAQEILAQGNIEIWENLDRAVATAVDLSREREKVTQGQQ